MLITKFHNGINADRHLFVVCAGSKLSLVTHRSYVLKHIQRGSVVKSSGPLKTVDFWAKMPKFDTACFMTYKVNSWPSLCLPCHERVPWYLRPTSGIIVYSCDCWRTIVMDHSVREPLGSVPTVTTVVCVLAGQRIAHNAWVGRHLL